jgi:hypothetical protein
MQDRHTLFVFYDLAAKHCDHRLRASNLVENGFSTIHQG